MARYQYVLGSYSMHLNTMWTQRCLVNEEDHLQGAQSLQELLNHFWLIFAGIYMGLSINGGTTKMMVYNVYNRKSHLNGSFGGTLISGNHHMIYVCKTVLFQKPRCSNCPVTLLVKLSIGFSFCLAEVVSKRGTGLNWCRLKQRKTCFSKWMEDWLGIGIVKIWNNNHIFKHIHAHPISLFWY